MKEFDVFVGNQGTFTIPEMRQALEYAEGAIVRDGGDPETVRVELLRRPDLSGSPLDLMGSYEVKP